jgi:NADH:ubiquinone oxidoreductase subunit E
MTSKETAVEIVVCLGSSCFARGNAENLEVLRKYTQNNSVNVTLHLVGSLCKDQCKRGPNVMINGILHHGVDTAKLMALLEEAEKPGEETDGTPYRHLYPKARMPGLP